MNCPACGAESEVLDTRKQHEGVALRRRRKCSAGCGTFFTVERVVPLPIPRSKRP